MQELINGWIQSWTGADPATWPYTQWVHAAIIAVVVVLVAAFAAMYGGIASWAERRVAGRIQSRIGPNRNGPAGFFQWIADAAKLLFKEDTIPESADRKLFKMAPYFVFIGFLMTFVALPFSKSLIAADLNLGIFYIVSITALVVVGMLMSGWSSNSKWSLFGGIRSAAQVVSYEIPAGLSLLIPVLMAGTLSTQGLIEAQGGVAGGAWWQVGGWPWNWTMFANPMAFAGFFIFVTATLAEGNRTPFDLPEAESELVSGYNTEYSGFRFALFFLVEFGNLYVMGALATVLFLGGWQIPGLEPKDIQGFWLEALSLLFFMGKVVAMTFVYMWLRWTLPRIRVDQMMNLCWKYLVPITMGLVVLTAASEWLTRDLQGVALSLTHLVFFLLVGMAPLVLFVRQTARNIRLVGDRVDLTNW